MDGLSAISEVTRRNIFDVLSAEGFQWFGRLDEPTFLGRLFDLAKLQSTDHRFTNAERDIRQHREYNYDWPQDWVFTDTRFNLLRRSDDNFLRFLCEMVHPVVQPDQAKVDWLIALFNQHLEPDGWAIGPRGELSGRPLYAPRRLLQGAEFAVKNARVVAETIDADYLNQQILRLERAVLDDPELAIGTAKEFLETVCKNVIKDVEGDDAMDDLPQLVKRTLRALRVNAEPHDNGVADQVRRMVGGLGGVVQALAELRNRHGTGHGKHPNATGLDARHARLAVGAATTMAAFLFETHQAMKLVKR